MKQIASHMLVPLIFLLSSLFIYFAVVESLVPSKENGAELIMKLERAIVTDPDKAANCGLGYHLAAEKSLQASQQNLLSALRKFLVEGAIGLFILSFAWQIYIHRKFRQNS